MRTVTQQEPSKGPAPSWTTNRSRWPCLRTQYRWTCSAADTHIHWPVQATPCGPRETSLSLSPKLAGMRFRLLFSAHSHIAHVCICQLVQRAASPRCSFIGLACPACQQGGARAAEGFRCILQNAGQDVPAIMALAPPDAASLGPSLPAARSWDTLSRRVLRNRGHCSSSSPASGSAATPPSEAGCSAGAGLWGWW